MTSVEINRKVVKMNILEIAGKQENLFVRESFLENHCFDCNGFLLVYSINDKRTFISLEEIYQAIVESNMKKSPVKDFSKSKVCG